MLRTEKKKGFWSGNDFNREAETDNVCRQNNWPARARQIDWLAYDLYGLTEEEIAIVENAQKQQTAQ
jgi:hypothetical protein